MKFLLILVTLVAAVASQMVMPFGPYAVAASYSAPLIGVNPSVMTRAAVPLPYSGFPNSYATAPVTYVAPGPISHQTGAKIVAKYEPVEQHGYQIAY